MVGLNRGPSGEWRLHKAEPPEPGFLAAGTAFGMIPELVTWPVQSRVFIFLAFDGARFSAARPLGNQVGR